MGYGLDMDLDFNPSGPTERYVDHREDYPMIHITLSSFLSRYYTYGVTLS